MLGNIAVGIFVCLFVSSSPYNTEKVLLFCVACKAMQEACGRDANFMPLDWCVSVRHFSQKRPWSFFLNVPRLKWLQESTAAWGTTSPWGKKLPAALLLALFLETRRAEIFFMAAWCWSHPPGLAELGGLPIQQRLLVGIASLCILKCACQLPMSIGEGIAWLQKNSNHGQVNWVSSRREHCSQDKQERKQLRGLEWHGNWGGHVRLFHELESRCCGKWMFQWMGLV